MGPVGCKQKVSRDSVADSSTGTARHESLVTPFCLEETVYRETSLYGADEKPTMVSATDPPNNEGRFTPGNFVADNSATNNLFHVNGAVCEEGAGISTSLVPITVTESFATNLRHVNTSQHLLAKQLVLSVLISFKIY